MRDSAGRLNNFHAFRQPRRMAISQQTPSVYRGDHKTGGFRTTGGGWRGQVPAREKGQPGGTKQKPMPSTPSPPMPPPVPVPVPSSRPGRRRKHAHADRHEHRHEQDHEHEHERGPEHRHGRHRNGLAYDYDFDDVFAGKRTHDYSYDPASNREGLHGDEEKGQMLRRRDVPFTWTKEDSWVTQILLLLRLIHASPTERADTVETNHRPKPRPRQKSKLRSRPKMKSRMRQRSSKEDTRSSAEGTPTPIQSQTKFRSKNHHRERKKLRNRAKRLMEKLDVNSAQYKLLHSDRSTLRRISRTELSKHILPSLAHINKVRLNEKPDGIWMLIHGYVFDVAGLLEHHPGGAECLLDCAGVDATRVFDDVGHSDIAWEMLENCCVGFIEDLESSEEDEEEGEGEHEEAVTGQEADNDNDNTETVDEEENELETEEEETREASKDRKQTSDVETDGWDAAAAAEATLVWNKRALEYLVIIICALFGLCCLVVLQRKKWETWEEM